MVADGELIVHPSAREEYERLMSAESEALHAWWATPHFRAEHAGYGFSVL